MNPRLLALFNDADARAFRIASLIRLVLILGFALMYLTLAPEGYAARNVAALIAYSVAIATALGALLLIRLGLYHPRLGLWFSVFDTAWVSLVMIAASYIYGIPIEMTGALPPFLFIPILLALAGLRYGTWTVPACFLTFAVIDLGALLAVHRGWLPHPGGGPPEQIGFLFAPGVAVARVVIVGMLAIVLTLAVIRGRQTLLRAIETTQARADLSRFLPQAIVDAIADQGLETVGHGRQQTVAVLFADIRGFTKLAESMDPADVGALLGRYRREVTLAIEGQGGIVDKFIGDAAMGVFGVPGPPDGSEARAAIAAGLDLCSRLRAWNRQRSQRFSSPPLVVGIGIHYGPAFVGTVGSLERLEFTVVGDTVNVAQRLEAATKTIDAPLLISRVTAEAAGGAGSDWRRFQSVALPGRNQPIDLVAPPVAPDP